MLDQKQGGQDSNRALQYGMWSVVAQTPVLGFRHYYRILELCGNGCLQWQPLNEASRSGPERSVSRAPKKQWVLEWWPWERVLCVIFPHGPVEELLRGLLSVPRAIMAACTCCQLLYTQGLGLGPLGVPHPWLFKSQRAQNLCMCTGLGPSPGYFVSRQGDVYYLTPPACHYSVV